MTSIPAVSALPAPFLIGGAATGVDLPVLRPLTAAVLHLEAR